jgi:general secretion pathway protein I
MTSLLHNRQGFTLLELLVALLIAGMALAVLFQGAGGGLRAAAVANRYQEALAHARSRLATIGHGLALAPLHQRGEDGYGFHWQIDITRTGSAVPLRQPADAMHGAAPQLALYAVQVSESWMGEAGPRQVRLMTERIGIVP